jgi:hypothetical protein
MIDSSDNNDSLNDSSNNNDDFGPTCSGNPVIDHHDEPISRDPHDPCVVTVGLPHDLHGTHREIQSAAFEQYFTVSVRRVTTMMTMFKVLSHWESWRHIIC